MCDKPALKMTMNCHVGVTCNNCKRENFYGMRYKCLVCDGYDLCTSCYNLKIHDKRHPMQCILIPHVLRNSLTCPYCGTSNFNNVTLHEHVFKQHKIKIDPKVHSPLCSCNPEVVHETLTTHLDLTRLTEDSQTVSPLPFSLEELPSGSGNRLERIDDSRVQDIPVFLQEIQDEIQAFLGDASENSS